MNRKLMLVVASVATLAACDGFKEAMTAHVDYVARVGSQELTVTRLAELVGGAQKIPLNKDVAKAVANLWVEYQLLARAAAQGDSVTDPAKIDEAFWAELQNMRAQKFYGIVSATWKPDSASEAAYNQGDLLAAQHILILVPQSGLSTAAREGLRRKADSIRRIVTPANFARLARVHSQDPGSKERGGSLGVFIPAQMVKEFTDAVIALKPGEISPVVQTEYGYHIIRRHTYPEVRAEFAAQYANRFQQLAEERYMNRLEQSGNIVVRDNAPTTVKAVAADLDGHREDRTVIATSTAGELTAGRLARWIRGFPPQMRQQMLPQIAQAPDSQIPLFVRQIVRNELVLKQADSAQVAVTDSERTALHTNFSTTIASLWNQLGVHPTMLADSARTPADRERIASERANSYLDNVLAERARFVAVPEPVSELLREKYNSKINEAGIDRALERATRIRAALDSTRAGQQPSQVPMPPGMVVPGPNGPQQLPQQRPPARQPGQQPPARQPGQQPPARP